MNFLEPDTKRLKSLTFMKFKGNVQFLVDEDSIRGELVRRYGGRDQQEQVSSLITECQIIDPKTGMGNTETVVFSFVGLFQLSMVGRLWMPEGVAVKDFDKYIKAQPYILSFYYDDLKTFELKPTQWIS